MSRIVALPGDGFLQRHQPGAHSDDIGTDVLQRIDCLKARRRPFGIDRIGGQGADRLARGDEPLPHRPAQPRHQQLPLQRLHPSAELDQAGTDRGVVDLGEVAGEQLVGEADTGGDRVQLHAHVFSVSAGMRRRGELHVLAGAQVLDHPRLEALDPAAVGSR
nr:esterase [uncultured bacterium]